MGQAEEDRVGDQRAGPAFVELGIDAEDRPEELHRLVDKVAAQVVERPARLLGPFPPAGDLGQMAPESRFDAVDGTEQTVADELPHGQEVAVPAAVLVDAQEPAAAERGVGEACRLRGAPGDRLVHNDVLAGLERGDPQRHVPLVRGHHHDQLDGAFAEERRGVVDDACPGVLAPRRLGPPRVPGHDAEDPEALDGPKQRGVEAPSGESVAEQTDADHSGNSRSARRRGQRRQGRKASA